MNNRGERAKWAKWGEFTPAVGGEKGESSKELALTPLPTYSVVVKQPTENGQSELLQSYINDEALTFARQLRTRFADCRLTYHATDGRLRGRLPYWWAEVAR